MELDKKLHEDIKEYCRINKLKMTKFVNDLLRKAFTIEKFGEQPPFFIPVQKTIDSIKEEGVSSDIKKEDESSNFNIHQADESPSNPKVYSEPAEINSNAIWDDSEIDNKPIIKIDPNKVNRKRKLN